MLIKKSLIYGSSRASKNALRTTKHFSIDMIFRSFKAITSFVCFVLLEVFRAVIFYQVVLRVQQTSKESGATDAYEL